MHTIPRKRAASENLHFKYLSVRRSNSSAASVTECVLYNPELLENILLFLPQRDILVSALRVSRLWNAIIKRSPSLQRLLYFLPEAQSHVTGYQVNPLLLWSFLPWFRSFVKVRDGGDISRNDFKLLDWNKSVPKREAYARKEASWRKMFVTSPVTTELTIERRYDGIGSRNIHFGVGALGDGLRMGPLYDLAQHAANQCFHHMMIQWVFPRWSGAGAPLDKGGSIKLGITHVVSFFDFEGPSLEGFRSEGYEPLIINWID